MFAIVFRALPWIVAPILFFTVRHDVQAVSEKGKNFLDRFKKYLTPTFALVAVGFLAVGVYSVFGGKKR